MIILECDEKSALLSRVLKACEKHLQLSGRASVELVFCDEAQIRQINKSQRGIDRATDVLSFPFLSQIMPFYKKNYPLDYDPEKKRVFIGTIIICNEIAQNQAKEYSHSLQRETAYLFLHGFLHLLGFDHETDSDKTKMRKIEEEVLQSINLARN